MSQVVGGLAGGDPAGSHYYYVLAGTPMLVHSNSASDAHQIRDASSIDSKFDTMCAELLPKSEIVAFCDNEDLRTRVTPPEGYYLCSLLEKFCTCPFVMMNGPFNKVGKRTREAKLSTRRRTHMPTHASLRFLKLYLATTRYSPARLP